jgi:uroporphyrinogen decarboxylase
MKDKKNLLIALDKKTPDATPIWLMRQAGRYLPEYQALRQAAGSFMKLVLDPDLAAQITLQPVARFRLDGAIVFSDILMVSYGLGLQLDFIEGEGPKLETAKTIPEFNPEIFFARTRNIYETVKKTRAKLPENTALIGFAGAPFTVALYMLGGSSKDDFQVSLRRAARDDKAFTAVLQRIGEATIFYLKEQIKAGAEALQLFDSWAGLAPADQFFDWIIEPTSRIIEAIKKEFPHIPIIGFPRGAGKQLAGFAKNTGVDALSLDSETLLAEAQKNIPATIVLQGNLDPALLEGEQTRMLQAAENILRTARRPFIFNLGHGLTPRARPENVAALVEYVHSFKSER